MKVFIAITCFALVAVALGEETSVPPSIGGSLLRTKGGLLNNAADRWDRWMQSVRGFVPFGSINAGLNIGGATTAKPTTTTTTATTATTTSPAAGASPTPSATVGVNITGSIGYVECGRKKFVQAQLNETIAEIDATEKAINDPASGLKKALDDANALDGSDAPKLAAKNAAILKATTNLVRAEENRKTLELREQQLNGQLEVYAVCKD